MRDRDPHSAQGGRPATLATDTLATDTPDTDTGDGAVPVRAPVRSRSAALPAAAFLVGLVSIVAIAIQGRQTDPTTHAGSPAAPFWLTVTQADGERARVALSEAGDATFQGSVRLVPPKAVLPEARLSWSDPSRPERHVTLADVRIRLDRLLHRRAPMELAFGWLTLDERLGEESGGELNGELAGAPHGGRSGPGPGERGARWYYVLRLDRAAGMERMLRVFVKRTTDAPLAAIEGRSSFVDGDGPFRKFEHDPAVLHERGIER